MDADFYGLFRQFDWHENARQISIFRPLNWNSSGLKTANLIPK